MAHIEWINANGFLLENCSSNKKREEYEDSGNDELSVYGFCSLTLMPFSDLVCLTSICTAREENNDHIAGKH